MQIVALIIWPLFFLISYLLFRKTKLSMFSSSYSALGSDLHYGYLFNLILVTAGIIQLVFLVSVFRHISYAINIFGRFGLFFLSVTAISGIFTGIILERKYKKTHNIIATSGYIFSIMGYVFIGIYLLSVNITAGLLMLLWGTVVMPFQIYSYYINKKILAKNEIFMFIGAFLTNIILSLLFY